MDYNVKTGILIYANFNTREFNDLMYESAKPRIVEDIKSVIEKDSTLFQYKAARNCLGKGMVWEKNRSITEN